jgi:AcrR family transcriptional regulator
MPRQDLLDRVVGHLQTSGLGDKSLRQIAEAVGSSHRMLVYHFGSREGLLAAVVAEVERRERLASERAMSDLDDPTHALERVWAAVSAPDRANEERLFFELAGQALQRRPGTEALLESLITPWIEVGVDWSVAHGMSRDDAAVVTRMDVAIVRGLLMDLLATGDRRGVNEAFRRYVAQREASSAIRNE